jgi:hypothetical protein
VVEDVGEVATKLLDRRGAWQAGCAVGEVAQLVAAGDQMVASDREDTDAVGAGPFLEGGVLERGQVAVDGRLGLGDLRGDGVEFGGVPVGAFGAQGRLGGDGSGDEVGVAVEVDQGAQDCRIEEVRVDAGGGVAVRSLNV